MRLNLVNVDILNHDYSDIYSFKIDKYIFKKTKNIKKSLRSYQVNAQVSFSGNQKNSIVYKDGLRGYYRKTRRKFIEDILLLGSLLNGYNWDLYANKKQASFPIMPRLLYLNDLLWRSGVTQKSIEKTFSQAIERLENLEWQKQFENGFHLRMLKNRSNILNEESRFLSYFVIWEWLYPHLKNPNGATIKDEEKSIEKILNYIIKHNWPEANIKNNIFKHLRNQLTHSGMLPINREYNGCSNPEEWMKTLTDMEITHYMNFFAELTRAIVLKTLNIDSDKDIDSDLSSFLRNGRI